MGLDGEPEPLRQTDCSKDPGGIVQEAPVVKHPNHPPLDVGSAPRGIVQLVGVEIEGNGVDREIATKQIVGQASGAHRRKRPRLAVSLASGSGNVDLGQLGGGDLVGEELWIRADPPPRSPGQGAGEGGAPFLEGQIDVGDRPVQQQVAHRPSDQIGTALFLRCHFTDQTECVALWVGKAVETDHGCWTRSGF